MRGTILTKQNFEDEVLHSDIPVLVDFYADWCGPCRMLTPILDEVEKEHTGRIKIGRVNADEQPELAASWRVYALPTVLAFRNGKMVKSSIGYATKQQLLALLR